MRYLGKIQIGISKIQKRFCVYFSKSKNRSRILEIHTMSGFLGSNLNPHFWDLPFERLFWERIWKQNFYQRFSEQKGATDNRCRTCMTLKLNQCWWRHFSLKHISARSTRGWCCHGNDPFFGSSISLVENLFLNSPKKRSPRRFSQERRLSLMNRKTRHWSRR